MSGPAVVGIEFVREGGFSVRTSEEQNEERGSQQSGRGSKRILSHIPPRRRTRLFFPAPGSPSTED